jgi:hypothetical protein
MFITSFGVLGPSWGIPKVAAAVTDPAGAPARAAAPDVWTNALREKREFIRNLKIAIAAQAESVWD